VLLRDPAFVAISTGDFAMTPQSNFMIMAPIIMERIDALKTLLNGMNLPGAPGMADPNNAVVPFGQFDTLHYARFAIVDDRTLGDFALANLPVANFPVTLAFFGDCDGRGDDFLVTLVKNSGASKGLRRIFEHCEEFDDDTDLLAWMRHRAYRPAAAYVNWVGRTVAQVHKEAALRRVFQTEMTKYIESHPDAGDDPRGVHDHLVNFVERNPGLKPLIASTPIGWRIRNLLHFSIIPFALLLPWLLAIPFLIPLPKLFFWIVIPFGVLAILLFLWLVSIAAITFAVLAAIGLMLVPYFILFPLTLIPVLAAILVFVCVLRWYEKNEPEVIPRPTPEHDAELAALEDHDVGNQFTVIGSVKPSAFRRGLLTFILWLTDYGARHIYNRGFLSRIQSIHFARWVFVDGKRRVLFASNYDGSHQAYMDDFINKVGWGLNIVFSNGFGYPRTNWLILDGAKNELRFKDTNRRHQIPTQVWYKAYPGLTAFDLARNTRIREGLERRRMSDAEIRTWLRDL
jgi:hypothetical protein